MLLILVFAFAAISIVLSFVVFVLLSRIDEFRGLRDNDTREFFNYEDDLKGKRLVISQQGKQIESLQQHITQLNEEINGLRAWHRKVSEAVSTN